MDETDRRLIGLLRRDARQSAAEIAKTLGVSRATVANRLRRLEADGVIRGYRVELGEAADEEVRAWMSIKTEANHERKVMLQLLAEPAVRVLHSTNGRWDVLAELVAPSVTELGVILGRLRLLKGIQASETSLHLSTVR